MRALFLCLLLVPALTVFSQFEKYQEGYLVLVTGDTIRGQLSWKKNSTPSDKVNFKKHELDHPQVYTWALIAEILDKDKQQEMMVVNVKRNLEYIRDLDYTIMLKDSTAEGPVPLRPLYRGKKLSLYTLYDKSSFFFVYDGNQVKQLAQKYRYLTSNERMFDYENGRRFHITDEFKGVLAAYYDFSDDRKMRFLLANTLFEDRSMKVLISKMDSKMW
ncbi:MAG: hypothetical protein IPP99_22275 [Chitinophagaceae bacterium]|nr:hypothetical protein [Chitinophagaceae bacterium]MBP6590769.1 hypothetical protein [Chitinophagaceae bacterium]